MLGLLSCAVFLLSAGQPVAAEMACAAWAGGDDRPLLDDLAILSTEVPANLRTGTEPARALAHSGAPTRQVVVDVMILYTGLAKTAYGEEVLQQRMALAVAYLNEACNRSGVNARFRLVHSEETTWHTERPLAADELAWLCTDERVAELRDEYGADLVSLIARDVLPTGGLGQLPGSFSVSRGNACVFAHECGHNLGLSHDRANAASYMRTSETAGFGYCFVPPGSEDLYGDIMSYLGSQIDQFSNPERYFMDAPTGLVCGHTGCDGQPDSADAASVLNYNIPYAATSRACQVDLLALPSLADDGAEFGFVISGPQTGACQVDYTADFTSWTRLTNCWLTGEQAVVSDNVAECPHRFYRARIEDRFIVNQIGFVKKTIPSGFSMVANPLETLENTVATLFTAVPDGTQIYRWIEGRQKWQCNTFSLGEWDDATMTVHPGEGILVRNPAEPFTIGFLGEVNQALHNRVPLQHSLRSSAVPLTGGITSNLGLLPFGEGCQLIFMTGQSYDVRTWDGTTWSPSEPVIGLAESFWCRNSLNAYLWQRVLPK